MYKRFIFTAVIAIMLMDNEALAQIDTELDVDVGVILEDAPPPPLAMKIERPLRFGRVTIPSTLRREATCRYAVVPPTLSRPEIQVSSLRDPSNQSGCAFISPPSTALIQLFCQPGLDIFVEFTPQKGGVPGVEMPDVLNDSAPAIFYASREQISQRTDLSFGGGGAIQCSVGANQSFGLIELGSAITVDRNLAEKAQRATALSVGSIRIDMFYM